MQMRHSDSHAGEKNPARVLLVSLALNCVLAAAAFHWWTPPATQRPIYSSITNRTVITTLTRPACGSNCPPAATYVTNRFHWRQVESTNYDEYIANLRAIGCPEKTIRDIVLADVQKHYEMRSLAAGRQQPFWQGGKQREIADRAQAAEDKAMHQEESELLRRLLGIEWTDTFDPFTEGDLQDQAFVRFISGPLPEETFRRLMTIIGKYGSQESEVRERSNGIRTDEDEAQLNGLSQALKTELSGLLSPEQLDELAARQSAIDLFHSDLLGEVMGLTPAEARQIALAKFQTRGAPGFFGAGFRREDDDPAESERQFTNAVVNLIGAGRFEDFQRAQDREFQALFEISRDNNLSKETAIKVYDIRGLTLEEIRRLRHDGTLDESARRQRFDEMQSTLQREVSGLLGATAYGEYLQRGGAWITNLTKL